MSIDKKAVRDLIEHRIVPLAALDGGVVELIAVDDDDGTVSVRFGGTYRGSPCRSTLIDFVLKPLLRQTFDTVVNVKMVD